MLYYIHLAYKAESVPRRWHNGCCDDSPGGEETYTSRPAKSRKVLRGSHVQNSARAELCHPDQREKKSASQRPAPLNQDEEKRGSVNKTACRVNKQQQKHARMPQEQP